MPAAELRLVVKATFWLDYPAEGSTELTVSYYTDSYGLLQWMSTG